MRILNVPPPIQYQVFTHLCLGSQNKRLVNPNWMKGQKHDMFFNSFHLLVFPEIFKGFATRIPQMQHQCLFLQFFIPCPPTQDGQHILKHAIILNFMCIFGGTKIHGCAIITPHLSHDQFNLCIKQRFCFQIQEFWNFMISYFGITKIHACAIITPHLTMIDSFYASKLVFAFRIWNQVNFLYLQLFIGMHCAKTFLKLSNGWKQYEDR